VKLFSDGEGKNGMTSDLLRFFPEKNEPFTLWTKWGEFVIVIFYKSIIFGVIPYAITI
jgi:hypothetical protein